MADLRLVGLTDDGSRLILEREGGGADHLAVDDRLRTMVSDKRTRNGTPASPDLESNLSPREIQARIRSGQTPEEVAEDAGISVERVERFAGPILHEREYIAQEAAKVSVRRDDHGAVMLLGELVSQRLEQRGVPQDSLAWDAWRRDDGAWEVKLDYSAGGRERSANWVYDPSRRTVTADDDEARWLLEEPTAAPVTQLRPVPTEVAAEDVEDAAGLASDTDAPPEQKQVKSGTQEAIDTLMRGRDTVPETPTRKRKKKPTVPTWDEILFGSRKPE
ncbi:MAG TPA: septation protein SepH [Actinomycetes bacterium]|nr:septation protein SepH [Actinomycetes bacterium]